MRRVGLLGGTFDPPHAGHLKLGELAFRTLGLDEVLFVPAALPPHKTPSGGAPGPAARLRLVEEALAGLGLPFRADPLEVERGGTSYTVDTLEALAVREPGTAWILILGGDQLPGFPRWWRPERILDLASLAVALRPGFPEPRPEGLLEGRIRSAWSGAPGELVLLPSTELELGSTGLREALARGGKPEGIPPQVMAAILREKQYR